MKLSGKYEFNAPPEQVWRAMTEPESLRGCIPGCQSLTAVGDDDYEAALTVALGPIRGKFDAKVAMRDQVTNESYRLLVESRGTAGFVNGEARVTLTANGDTTTVYVEGESQAGGLLARVGQRMMDSVARQMMDRFFTCLGESTGISRPSQGP